MATQGTIKAVHPAYFTVSQTEFSFEFEMAHDIGPGIEHCLTHVSYQV